MSENARGRRGQFTEKLSVWISPALLALCEAAREKTREESLSAWVRKTLAQQAAQEARIK